MSKESEIEQQIVDEAFSRIMSSDKATAPSPSTKELMGEIIRETSIQSKDDTLFAQPVSSPTPSELSIPADKVTVINVDDIKPNSILIINIDVKSPGQKMEVAPAFSKLLAPYAPKLREKHITVMLMALDESIAMVSEADMNAAGWEKKKKSLIINPFEK